MRIAITGGTGFIGHHLIARLVEEGHEIRSATRQKNLAAADNVEFFSIDLEAASTSRLEAFLGGCDVLIHMAGEVRDSTRMFALHVEATQRLTCAANAVGITHWVQMSSCGVYGRVWDGAVFEDSPKQPSGEYEVTKWEAEEVAREWGEKSQRCVTILRPSIIYGPDMPSDSLRALVRTIRRGFFFFIGPAGSAYNCVYVDDVISAVLKSLDRKGPGVAVFNISTFNTVEQLVGAITQATGQPFPRRRIPEKLARSLLLIARRLHGFPLTSSRIDALTARADYRCDKIRDALGWAPQVDLNTGICELVGRMALGYDNVTSA